MASPKLSDIINSEELTNQVSSFFPNHIQLETSNAVLVEPIDNISNSTRITIPRWKQGGDFEPLPLSGDKSLSKNKNDTITELGIVIRRGKAFGGHDFARLVDFDDPQTEIAKQIASIFARHLDATLIKVLEGAIPAANMKNVSVVSGSAVRIGKNAVLEAMLTLGNNENDIACVVMHSKVFRDCYDQGLIIYTDWSLDTQNSGQRTGLHPTLFGRPVYVSDRVPVDTTVTDYFKYQTYFLGHHALYLGYQRELSVETDCDMLTKEDILSFDAHFVPHLFGTSWNSELNNPSNTALATPTNWVLKVEDAKSVRAVALITN